MRRANASVLVITETVDWIFRRLFMRYRFPLQLAICAALIFGFAGAAWAQGNAASDLSTVQRLDVMRSKLEAMRRSLNSAIASMGAAPSDKEKKNPDDPRERLRGLDKEAGSILSEVNDVRSKQERSDKYDHTILDRLETSVAEIKTRVEAGLQSTASARTASVASSGNENKKKKKGGH